MSASEHHPTLPYICADREALLTLGCAGVDAVKMLGMLDDGFTGLAAAASTSSPMAEDALRRSAGDAAGVCETATALDGTELATVAAGNNQGSWDPYADTNLWGVCQG